jgi:hypothetical protein
MMPLIASVIASGHTSHSYPAPFYMSLASLIVAPGFARNVKWSNARISTFSLHVPDTMIVLHKLGLTNFGAL